MCVASVAETHRCQICSVHWTSCRVDFVQIALREAAIAPAVWLGRVAGGNEQWGNYSSFCSQQALCARVAFHASLVVTMPAVSMATEG